MFEFEINRLDDKEYFIEFVKFKTGQMIKYYFNTYLPDNIDKFRCYSRLGPLIVAGHHPDGCIMDYKKRLSFNFYWFYSNCIQYW